MSAKRKTAGENAARTAPEMRAASEVRPAPETSTVAEVRPAPEMGTVPEEFSALLLDWYRKNARVLPWREDPSPYRVWVSEIMLQQTRVEAVKPYFEQFLAALPDLEALASAEEERLLKLWEGLGYYNRVKNMQKAAVMALEEYGGLPEAAEELIRLPGIGPYTAGAVASIAFGQPVPAVDGNVLRVMTRLLAYGADISSATVKKEVETALRPHVASDPRAFNQALMELGATVCLPNGAPKCERCPVTSLCAAHRDGQELDYPVKRAKKKGGRSTRRFSFWNLMEIRRFTAGRRRVCWQVSGLSRRRTTTSSRRRWLLISRKWVSACGTSNLWGRRVISFPTSNGI